MGDCLKCPNGHDATEVLRYIRLPTIVLPACRFDDVEYLAEAKLLFPYAEFVRNQPLPIT